jgi:hypothetical protein
MDYPHLNKSAIEALALSDEERIEKIRSDRWIGYPAAISILNKMEDLLTHPRNQRMPNMLIVGDTNNGKTMLVNRFLKAHPADDNPEGDGVLAPVMVVQAPPKPDEGRFYNAILEMLFAPYRPSERVDKKQFQVIKLLRYVGLKVLVVDEIHHILAGNLNSQRAFLNVLKYMGNELQISIVGVGTKDAFRALQTEPQLANRFKPEVLPRWEYNDDFLRLLASFERMLPLHQPSILHEAKLSAKLFKMCEGYIGELSGILCQAAAYSVRHRVEQINMNVLDSIDWVSPSARKRQLDSF